MTTLTHLFVSLPEYAKNLPLFASAPRGEENRRAVVARHLQSEDEQHRLIALIAQLRCQGESTFADVADAGKNGDVLLTTGLEGHGRRVEACPDIEFPDLIEAGVVIGDEAAIHEGGENETARRRQ